MGEVFREYRFSERVWMRHEDRKGVKDLGGRQLLCLRKERTTTNGIGG
jgi:hypothetical protein